MSILNPSARPELLAEPAQEPDSEAELALATQPAPARNWDLWLLLTVALGAALRFIALGRQSMWYDELFTLFVSMKSLPSLIATAAADTSPPLFYVAEHFVARYVGKGEVAMRALPALAGVITIWVVYLAGRRLFAKKAAFWAATLFAIAYMPIRYAQEARAYSFLMLFAALSLLTLLRLADRPGPLNALAFCLSLAALAYTHLYGVFGGVAIVLAMLLIPTLRRRAGWWGVGAAALAAALFVPWGLVMIGQMRTVDSWVDAGSWPLKRPTNLALEFWSAIESFTPWAYPETIAAVVFSGALVSGLWGLRSVAVPLEEPSPAETPAAETDPADAEPDAPDEPEAAPALGPLRPTDRDIALLLGICVVVPLALALVLSVAIMPIQELRSYLVCAPAAYLLAAYGALRMRPIVSFMLLMVLLSSAVLGLPHFYAMHNKGYYREAVQYLLSRNAQDERLIVSSNYLPLNLNMYCIVQGYERQFRLDSVKWFRQGQPLDNDIKPLLAKRNSVWIVTAFVPTDEDGATNFDASMNRQNGWRLVETQDFDGRPKVEHWVLDPNAIVED